MKKAASLSSLLLLWVLAAGCQSQATQARVHLRVFEVPTQILQSYTANQSPHKLSDSVYSVSVVTPKNLDAMLRSNGAPQRLLAERSRVIKDWPAVTDTWVYTPGYVGMGQDTICTGGGVGSLGVREHGSNLEVRFDYLVNHRGPQGQRLVESKLYYDHDYPEGQILLFHAPARTPEGNTQQHVIAFEITRTGQPPQVLAYR
jgi:hypothetical protein